MKKTTTYKLLSVVIVCIFMLQSQVSIAQWTADVAGMVKKEETNKRMAGATITIKRNGVVWKTVLVDAKGRFDVPLLPGAIYLIEVSKPMHVTKRVEISTENVPPEDAKLGFDIPFDISLFEKMDGLDVSILDKPIGKIRFDPDAGYIISDAAYAKSIKAELDRLKKELAERLKAEEENKKQNQKSYDAAILAADKAFNAGEFEGAIPLYEKAAKIFPKETYPEFQLGDISDKLRGRLEADKRYKSTIVKADVAFKAREWEKAVSAYEHASYLKESEQYPKDKVKEIKSIIANEKKLEKEYNELIVAADQSLLSKDYEKAKVDYGKASTLKSYEQYPKDKLSEIEKILAEIAKKEAERKAKEAKYKGLIAAADNMLGTKNYDGSKGKYNEALAVMPDEQYPKDKLVEIEGILAEIARKEAERKAKEAQYKGLIAEADKLIGTKDYNGSKAKYNEALGVKSAEQYPKDQIKEIDRILAEIAKKEAEEKAKEAKYQSLIVAADGFLGSKNYDGAKGKYNEALNVKSAEQYPKDKIAEIEGILAELAKKEAERKAQEALDADYQGLITTADGFFNSKNYEGAKGKYNEALKVKSAEQYPKDKIVEIEGILVELAKKEAERKAQEALDAKYQGLITAADGFFWSENYEGAKGKYNEALKVKSAEQYPKDKLVEIEGILAEIAKKEVERKAREAEEALNAKYQGLITAADGFFNSKNYEGAKGKYNEALKVKSAEQYPKDKLVEIEGILAEIARKEAERKVQEALDAKYQGLITAADGFFNSKNYEGAKGKYNEALVVKSAEQYPKDKIAEIEGIIAAIAKKEAEEKAREAKYQGLIVAADGLLASKNYEGAKGKYNEALDVKSTEQYPKDKVKEIENILAEIARKKAAEEAAKMAAGERDAKYGKTLALADAALLAKNYEEAKGKYNEALGIKSAEQYPKDKLAEIEIALAEIAKKKASEDAANLAASEKDAKYNQAIKLADNALNAKSYQTAKSKYNEALGIKSAEQYPKDKLAEIEIALANLVKKNAEDAANSVAMEIEAKYNEAIKMADKALTAKSYQTAKGKYNEALGIKSAEQYPKDKLAEIEIALANLVKKNAEDAANSAAMEKEAKYNEVIKMADKALTAKSYQTAKGKYNEALGIKSAEQYPKDKLAEIEIALANLAKKNAEDAVNSAAMEIEAKYNEAIKMADKALIAKSYQTAKSKYNEALRIKSAEQYPKDKLAEIEIALASLAEKNAEDALAIESERKKRAYFDALIAEADGELVGKNYDAAKVKYNEALEVIPGDQYPKDKLKEIANILAGIKSGEENAVLAKKQLEENYKRLIAQGDDAFSGKNYKGAKPKYKEALSLKSSEAYPRNQLAEIERILGEIAAKESEITLRNNAQKQREQAYANFIKKGDEQLSQKQYRSSLSNFQEALNIKSAENYPQEKIVEINKILAELALKERANSANVLAEKERRKEYNKFIYDADRSLRLKDYEKAKRNYNSALSLYTSEQYPKDKLAEIEGLLNKPKEEIFVKNTNNKERAKINDDNEREIERRMALMMGKPYIEKKKKLEKEKADYNHQEIIRVSGGIERTIAANKEFEIYKEQESKIVKDQEDLSVEKYKAHHIDVDKLQEGNHIMRERGEELRESNRKEIVKIATDNEKGKRKGRKRRKEKELDVLDIKSKVAEQEEIRLRASIGRTTQNENDIKRLSEDMANMRAAGIDSYKENVIAIVAYKKELNNSEADMLDRVAKKRYKKTKLVNEYKEEISKQEKVNRKEANERRVASNEELLTAKGKLGETTTEQKKRYEDFHEKLKEEQDLNNRFLADLQLMERDKILLASASLQEFYMGESRPSVDEELASKYSEGITEETIESGSSVVIKRTKVTGKHVDVYERVFYRWGGSYFMKNGVNITQSLWDKESID